MSSASSSSSPRQRKGSGDIGGTKTNDTDSSNVQSSSKSSGTTGSFECNICLDGAQDAVVSMCGHLFCWPCLHRWFETAKSRPVCPVCKAAISRDKVIPLYGRGADHTQDPRNKVPPRPTAQRVEPDSSNAGGSGVFGGLFGTPDGGTSNFRMSVGIGAFPFGFLTTAFSLGVNPTNSEGNAGSVTATRDAEILSGVCFCLALFFIGWLFIL